MPLTILRLATLFGEKDPGNIGRLIRWIAEGRFIWIGNGSNHKNLLWKEDAAQACILVATMPAAGISTFNVVGNCASLREIVAIISQLVNRKIPRFHLPLKPIHATISLLSMAAPRRLGKIKDVLDKWGADDVFDGSKFSSRYGFKPQVSIADGLKLEVDWYRNQQSK